ncbi:TPA: trp operon leader peptide [Salmonella enterica subsp. salamae serovar 16:m,t:e,n,x]|nr:trp operon leader peptide [Salmonella enterica subsp. salamae]EKT7565513.1 trp operon leader peptide [Salmonella enterica]EKT7775563.1 trp operon leader peptide [Salmonella enterica]HCL5284897.1 trp operon leader peptide [Salmonella enterica]HCM1923177.1 trp operon leader peptide [Salmonella enterica subsp. salamae serovar 16:m,t:e,n,x]
MAATFVLHSWWRTS